MVRKPKSKLKRLKKSSRAFFRRPLALTAMVMGFILLAAWISGGFEPLNQNLLTEPASFKNVRTMPASAIAIAPPPPSSFLWQGPIQPAVIPPGTAPVIYKLPITEPVVFLTIDDGWAKPQDGQDWLVTHRLPFSLFLTNDAIKSNYDYFQKLQAAGMAIQGHTLSHPRLNKLPVAGQKNEICGASDTYEKTFGRRPTLLRPPYGLMDGATIQAAEACGMRAIVMWHASVENGAMHYQDGNHLVPGDIVLMHFHSNMISDLQAFFNQVQSDHLQVGRLEDWLK